MPLPRAGVPTLGETQISSIWTRSDTRLHISTLELKAVILHYWVSVLLGCQVMIAADNSAVVAYINKQGGTHSHTLLRLVVDLFLWLQTQNIAIRARHIPGSLNVIADRLSQAEAVHNNRVKSPPRNSEPNIRDVENFSIGHVCHSLQHASSPVYVSSSGALSTCDRCSVTRLAEEVDVHVSSVPPAQPSHSEAQDHPGGRSDTSSPLVAITTVVSTSAMSVWTTLASFCTAGTYRHNMTMS